MIAILAGLTAGALHVLMGPDHLAAVAPLAVRWPVRAWMPGVRWGFGHSAGVGVVGLVSLWLRDLLPVDLLSSWGERLVGVLLLGIGLWALRRALKNTVHAHGHVHDGQERFHFHIHHHLKNRGQPESHLHTHAAFGIGILHGLAGSSHFLGVLPILAFPTNAQAVAYLAAFGLGTIATMAAFSGGMGLVAQRCSLNSQKVYRGLVGTCAVAAMGLGCFWLTSSY